MQLTITRKAQINSALNQASSGLDHDRIGYVIYHGARNVIIFCIEDCDKCATTTAGPNQVRVEVQAAYTGTWTSLVEALADTTWKSLDTMPPELEACDALGGIAVCSACWTDEEPTPDPKTDFAILLDYISTRLATIPEANNAAFLARLKREANHPEIAGYIEQQLLETLRKFF